MNQSREIDRKLIPLPIKKKLAEVLKAGDLALARVFKVRDGIYLIRDVKGDRNILIQHTPKGADFITENMFSESDDWEGEKSPDFFENIFKDAESYLENLVLKKQWKEMKGINSFLDRVVTKKGYSRADDILEAWRHPSGRILASLEHFDGHGWWLFQGGSGRNAPIRYSGDGRTPDDGNWVEYDCPFLWATPKKIVQANRKDGRALKSRVKK